MEKSTRTQLSRRPSWQRLLLAFLIGLPTTFMFSFVGISTPIWWWPEIPFMVLLFALLLSIAYAEHGPTGPDGRHMRNSMLSAILLMVVFFLVELVLLQQVNILLYVGLLLVPLVVGLVAAFVAGSHKRRGFAALTGFVAWIGAALANMLATWYNYVAVLHTPHYKEFFKAASGSDGSAIIGLTLAAHLIGLAIACIGGEIGFVLHKRVVGPVDLPAPDRGYIDAYAEQYERRDEVPRQSKK
jgi:hypothetical protein